MIAFCLAMAAAFVAIRSIFFLIKRKSIILHTLFFLVFAGLALLLLPSMQKPPLVPAAIFCLLLTLILGFDVARLYQGSYKSSFSRILATPLLLILCSLYLFCVALPARQVRHSLHLEIIPHHDDTYPKSTPSSSHNCSQVILHSTSSSPLFTGLVQGELLQLRIRLLRLPRWTERLGIQSPWYIDSLRSDWLKNSWQNTKKIDIFSIDEQSPTLLWRLWEKGFFSKKGSIFGLDCQLLSVSIALENRSGKKKKAEYNLYVDKSGALRVCKTNAS